MGQFAFLAMRARPARPFSARGDASCSIGPASPAKPAAKTTLMPEYKGSGAYTGQPRQWRQEYMQGPAEPILGNRGDGDRLAHG